MKPIEFRHVFRREAAVNRLPAPGQNIRRFSRGEPKLSTEKLLQPANVEMLAGAPMVAGGTQKISRDQDAIILLNRAAPSALAASEACHKLIAAPPGVSPQTGPAYGGSFRCHLDGTWRLIKAFCMFREAAQGPFARLTGTAMADIRKRRSAAPPQGGGTFQHARPWPSG